MPYLGHILCHILIFFLASAAHAAEARFDYKIIIPTPISHQLDIETMLTLPSHGEMSILLPAQGVEAFHYHAKCLSSFEQLNMPNA